MLCGDNVMRRRAAFLALAATAAGCGPRTCGAVYCLHTRCSDGSAMPCFDASTTLSEIVDCTTVDVFGRGPDTTPFGSTYDNCQVARRRRIRSRVHCCRAHAHALTCTHMCTRTRAHTHRHAHSGMRMRHTRAAAFAVLAESG